MAYSLLALDNSLIGVIYFIRNSANLQRTNNTTVLSVLLNMNKSFWRQVRWQSNIIVIKYSRLAFCVCVCVCVCVLLGKWRG
jgi:hypothetical protein